MKLVDFLYSTPVDEQSKEEANTLAGAIDKCIPRDAEGNKDYQSFGKMLGDACFGAINAPYTQEARASFVTLFAQSLFEGMQKEAEKSPISSIVKGILNSAPVSGAAVKFMTGFGGR